PPSSALFPYTTLFRSRAEAARVRRGAGAFRDTPRALPRLEGGRRAHLRALRGAAGMNDRFAPETALASVPDRVRGRRLTFFLSLDRKSTRLNSSHVKI